MNISYFLLFFPAVVVIVGGGVVAAYPMEAFNNENREIFIRYSTVEEEQEE